MPIYPAPAPVVVVMNGVCLNFGQEPEFQPTTEDGVVVVPIRRILESAGAKVDWALPKTDNGSMDDDIYITYKGKRVALTQEYYKDMGGIGVNDNIMAHANGIFWPMRTPLTDAYWNSEVMSIPCSYQDNAPSVKTWHYIMPLGFVAKTFGFQLQWDEQNRTVKINTQP